MSLQAKPVCRTMWMFPRNIRRIEPWKISRIASLLDAAAGEAGSQELQDALYEELSRVGVKREKMKDGTGVENPGGLRTYLAQLACLGLFYVDMQKHFMPTHAGDLIIKGENPVGVLRCQLMRLQYPSVYGFGQNVQISPAMSVKPFVFLSLLLRDERLQGYLTQSETAVCVIYGRTFGDYEKCALKILDMRAGRLDGLRGAVDRLEDLCTPKRWKKPDDVLWERGITDAEQIANTAINYMIAVGFVVADKDDVSGASIYRLTSDQKALDDIARWMPEGRKIETVKKDPSTWINAQVRFGRYDKEKVMSIRAKGRVFGFAGLIRAAYIAEIEKTPYGFDHSAFVREWAQRWHKTEQEIEASVRDLRTRSADDISRAALINAANSGGAEALQLEIGMTNVFRRLGFDGAVHIGQKKPPLHRPGGYPDIYLRVMGDSGSGMADTKATTKYGFPIGDTQKLGTYYKDAWREIDPDAPSRFFLYIAGSFAKSQSTIMRNLDECTLKYGSAVSAVTVYALLDLAGNQARPTARQLMEVFSTPRFFNSDVQIIEAAKKQPL